MGSINGPSPGGHVPGWIDGVPTPDNQPLGPDGKRALLGPHGLPPVGGPGTYPTEQTSLVTMNITVQNLHAQVIHSDVVAGSPQEDLKIHLENFMEKAASPGATQSLLAPLYHVIIGQAQDLGLIPPMEAGPVEGE